MEKKEPFLLFPILQMSQSNEIFLEELFNTPELNMSDIVLKLGCPSLLCHNLF